MTKTTRGFKKASQGNSKKFFCIESLLRKKAMIDGRTDARLPLNRFTRSRNVASLRDVLVPDKKRKNGQKQGLEIVLRNG